MCCSLLWLFDAAERSRVSSIPGFSYSHLTPEEKSIAERNESQQRRNMIAGWYYRCTGSG
jgi:hypothetical protein